MNSDGNPPRVEKDLMFLGSKGVSVRVSVGVRVRVRGLG